MPRLGIVTSIGWSAEKAPRWSKYSPRSPTMFMYFPGGTTRYTGG